MSDTLRDQGYIGQYISLAGRKGAPGKGLKIWSSTPAPGTTPVVVCSPNSDRVYALITNEGTIDVKIAFDESFGNGYHTLKPNGSMLINQDMPWIGGIYAETAAGTGLLGLEEAMIE